MTDPKPTEVRRLDLFRGMDETQFTLMMRGAYVQNFPPSIDLIGEGEPSDFLHIVLSGSVELFSRWNSRETSMAIVRPVSTFILAATIRDAPYLMSARTIAKSRIALIPSQDVRAAFRLDGEFALAVVDELAQQYRSLIKSTKELKLRGSLERVANYIIREQQKSGTGAVFQLPCDKKRLASLLGMTAENLSRALRTLQECGIKIDGSQITIHNQDELERFAKPNHLIDDGDI